jgi:hypothetical protein
MTEALAQTLYAELWVSLASLLRSYTAVHGLNRSEQATVELAEDRILVRVGQRWLHLDRYEAEIRWSRENGVSGSMWLTENGSLALKSGPEEVRDEEMDMQAETWARELMQ